MPLTRWITGALLAGVATLTQAADDYSLVPDEFIYCTTCHGVELRGNVSVDAPRLNGMAGWYLKNQMLAFKKGHRGTHPEDLIGMEMQPQAAALSEEQIEDVVARAQPETTALGQASLGDVHGAIDIVQDRSQNDFCLQGHIACRARCIDGFEGGGTVHVTATRDDGSSVEFDALVRIDTPNEVDYYRHGGILHYVLRKLAA